MRRLRFLLPPLAAGVVVAVGLALAGGEDAGDASAGGGAGAARGEAPRSATVPMEDIEFQKQTVRVAVGGEVTWVNEDQANHTSTSSESPFETGGTWDTGIIPPGESATVSFDRAGTFGYLCTVHPFMTAEVTVTETAG